jgi:hypothetical protein
MWVAVRHIAARHRTYHRTVHTERLPPPRPNSADQMAVRPVSDRLTGRYGGSIWNSPYGKSCGVAAAVHRR